MNIIDEESVVDDPFHREDGVLSFFSSRPNWDPPTPSHAGEVYPPTLWFVPGGGGAHSLAGEGVEGHNSDALNCSKAVVKYAGVGKLHPPQC